MGESIHSCPIRHHINDTTKNNTNMKQKIIAVLVAMLAIFPAFASDKVLASIDGLWYCLVGDEALYCGEAYLSPETLTLKPHVEYEGKTYTVTGFKFLERSDFSNDYDWSSYEPFRKTKTLVIPSTVVNNEQNLNIMRGMEALASVTVTSEETDAANAPNGLRSVDGVLYTYDGTRMLLLPKKRTMALNEFPKELKIIGECSCEDACASVVNLPEGVITIERNAFYDASIGSLVIPASVTKLIRGAISSSYISSITLCGDIDFGNVDYDNQDTFDYGLNVLPWSLSRITLSANVGKINEHVFVLDCPNLTTISVEDGNVSYSAFDGCLYDKEMKTLLCVPRANKSWEYPQTLETIGDYAVFENDNITELTGLPKTVTTIGVRSFRGCRNIESLELTGSLASIGHHCFSGCYGLRKIIIGDNIKQIGEYAFSGGRSGVNREITCPKSMTVLPKGIFSGNYIRSITGCDNVEEIQEKAFYGTNLHIMVFDLFPRLKRIGVGAFAYAIFWDSGIRLPESVEEVGDEAFYGSTNYQYIDWIRLSWSLKKIGAKAFWLDSKAPAIKEVGCAAQIPPVCTENMPFSPEVYRNATLSVGPVQDYQSTTPWNRFDHIVHEEYSGVEEVADGGEEVRVSCVGGEMRVECADGTAVTVWSADGREAYSGTGSCTIALPRGIYIVRASSSTRKVIL